MTYGRNVLSRIRTNRACMRVYNMCSCVCVTEYVNLLCTILFDYDGDGDKSLASPAGRFCRRLSVARDVAVVS